MPDRSKNIFRKKDFSQISLVPDKVYALGASDQQIEALRHSKSYSALLSAYVCSARKNMAIKNWLKIIFFIVTMGAFGVATYCFYSSVAYVQTNFSELVKLSDTTMEAVLSMLTVVFPSVCSLIVAFMKIPETIAKYLFNKDEDRYMDSMIKNIQDYDTSMFSLKNKVDETLKNNKDKADDKEIKKIPSDNQGDSAKEQDA